MSDTHTWVTLCGGDMHGHQCHMSNDLLETAEPDQEFQPVGSKTTWKMATLLLRLGDREEQRIVLVPSEGNLETSLDIALRPKDGQPKTTEV